MKLHSYLVPTSIVLAIASVSQATVMDADWSNTFLLQGSGVFENPLVRVGFNPQPEPPGTKVLNLLDPDNPSVSQGSESETMSILFGIGDAGTPFRFSDPTPTAGGFDYSIFDALSGAALFDVFFEVKTDSGGSIDPASLVGFNPQPEPPGALTGKGFGFDLTSLSKVTLSMRMTDASGQALSFTQVPVASTLLLLPLALAIAARERRKSRR